jgi:uncharacterized RDD family membrane protein YckC/ribosomal protein S27E
MPIKVRCKQCKTVLTVSDKARGRAIKCRECGGRVQVGSGKRKARPTKTKRANPDNLFGGLDLESADDVHRKICPNCTAPVGDEDAICQKCGVDVETGVLGERERVRRARNAPPPEEFYGEVWKNGWRFLMAHKNWAVRTGLIWAMTGTMAICSVFTLLWYIDVRAEDLRNSGSGKVEITEEYVLIDLRGDEKGVANYDGKRYTKSAVNADLTLRLPGPRLGAMLSPPSLFWGLILFVSVLGFGGWAWTLALQVIRTTLAREKTIKRFQTDLFASMAMGFRSIFWPAVLLWPFVAIPVAVTLLVDNPMASGIAWACLFLIPVFLFLPSALIHLTQKYTYRAWLIDWMSRDCFKTLMPTLYVGALLFGLVLVVPITCGVLVALFYNDITSFYTINVENQLLGDFVAYDPEDGVNFFSFTFYRLPLLGMIAFVGSFVGFGILAFPAVFMMRVYGLFGYFFRPDLSLLNEQTELECVGFGPRLLASLIDSLLLVAMAGVAWFLGTYTTKIFGYLYDFSELTVTIASLSFAGIFMLALWGIYFATWECGQNRATLGKASMGMMVLKSDDQVMTLNHAFGRAAAGCLTCVTVFLGFAMCAFHPKKSALHDIITKTKVVWRGESDDA